MPNTLALGAKRFARSLRLAGSLGAYWLATVFGGKMRIQWLLWACALDHRNKLALHDLVEHRPAAMDGDAQTRLQQWACSIVNRDTLTFAKVVANSATTQEERARASLVDWAYRCTAQDAVSLFNLATRARASGSQDRGSCGYASAYGMRTWLVEWAQSFPMQDLVKIHGAASCDQRDDDPRVDGLYALIASMTNIECHPQAHLAQCFAVDLSEQKYEQSMSQVAQDRFVLFALGERRGKGYFVEFGATDGCELSNTYLLEREFGWNGILAEPNPAYQAALRRNRRCSISDECVWSRSGETLPFKVVDSYPPLSTIAEYQNADQHDRSHATTIEVPTISLNALLERHGAPRQIDYISIDTEGSELAILEAFDFSAYDVSVFTIEHNFTSEREKIQRLMQQQGYVPVLRAFSRWDDWYVRADLAARLVCRPSARDRRCECRMEAA